MLSVNRGVDNFLDVGGGGGRLNINLHMQVAMPTL